MSEKDHKIVEIFSTLIPQLNEAQKASVLAFGEGMAFLLTLPTAKAGGFSVH